MISSQALLNVSEHFQSIFRWNPLYIFLKLISSLQLRFLRVSKFDNQIAMGRLESMFALQKEWHELFGEFTFDSIEPILKAGMAEVMAKRDKDGCVVLSMRGAAWDPEVFLLFIWQQD